MPEDAVGLGIDAEIFTEQRVLAIAASKSPPLLTRCLPGLIMSLAKNRDVADFIGAPDTVRTCDLCLRKAALVFGEIRNSGCLDRVAQPRPSDAFYAKARSLRGFSRERVPGNPTRDLGCDDETPGCSRLPRGREPSA